MRVVEMGVENLLCESQRAIEPGANDGEVFAQLGIGNEVAGLVNVLGNLFVETADGGIATPRDGVEPLHGGWMERRDGVEDGGGG